MQQKAGGTVGKGELEKGTFKCITVSCDCSKYDFELWFWSMLRAYLQLVGK